MRAEQIAFALEKIAPTASDRDECRRHIEEVLDIVESAGRAAAHAKNTKTRMRHYSAQLKRFLKVSREHAAAGGALAMSLSMVERAVALDAAWSARWSQPSRSLKQECAVAMAYEVLTCYNPEAIVMTPGSTWDQLAVIFNGETRVRSLYRQMQNFAERYPAAKAYRRRVREPRKRGGEDPLLQQLRRAHARHG